MNILLVYPQRDQHKKSFIERFSTLFSKPELENINLVEISVYLPITWEEKLIDINTSQLKLHDVVWADYIIICAGKAQHQSTIATIRQCKSMKKKVVLCGNAIDDNDLEYNLVDHFVANPAGFEVFSNDVADNSLQKSYQAINKPRNEQPLQAYSLWGFPGKLSRFIQPFPA